MFCVASDSDVSSAKLITSTHSFIQQWAISIKNKPFPVTIRIVALGAMKLDTYGQIGNTTDHTALKAQQSVICQVLHLVIVTWCFSPCAGKEEIKDIQAKTSYPLREVVVFVKCPFQSLMLLKSALHIQVLVMFAASMKGLIRNSPCTYDHCTWSCRNEFLYLSQFSFLVKLENILSIEEV